MTERGFRIILGLWLIVGLYFNSIEVIYALIAVLIFEGITSFNVPLLVCKIRFGAKHPGCEKTSSTSKISFEAERALRFIIVLFILLPFIPGLAFLWWFPWIVGFGLIGAGLSGICPLVISLRYLGLR